MSDTPLTDYLEFDPYIEAHILKKIEELERENAALRADKERLKKLLPVPDKQGILFGKNTWISYDKITGYEGQDGDDRDGFYQTRVIARGFMQWANETRRAIDATRNHIGESTEKKTQP